MWGAVDVGGQIGKALFHPANLYNNQINPVKQQFLSQNHRLDCHLFSWLLQFSSQFDTTVAVSIINSREIWRIMVFSCILILFQCLSCYLNKEWPSPLCFILIFLGLKWGQPHLPPAAVALGVFWPLCAHFGGKDEESQPCLGFTVATPVPLPSIPAH